MIAHSTSRRNARKSVTLQKEATVLIEYTDAPILKCKAHADISLGNVFAKKGTTLFLIKSARRANRYYIVAFNESRGAYQCSCGCNMCEHEHLKTVRNFVMNTIVKPTNPEAPEMSTPPTMKEVKARSKKQSSKLAEPGTDYAAIAQERPLSADEWKVIKKADRARQRGWATEYREAAASLREEATA